MIHSSIDKNNEHYAKSHRQPITAAILPPKCPIYSNKNPQSLTKCFLEGMIITINLRPKASYVVKNEYKLVSNNIDKFGYIPSSLYNYNVDD